MIRTVDIDTTDIYLDRNVRRAGFEVAAEIEAGDSGAVVVLPGGIAAGMIWAKSTQRNGRAWACSTCRSNSVTPTTGRR